MVPAATGSMCWIIPEFRFDWNVTVALLARLTLLLSVIEVPSGTAITVVFAGTPDAEVIVMPTAIPSEWSKFTVGELVTLPFTFKSNWKVVSLPIRVGLG